MLQITGDCENYSIIPELNGVYCWLNTVNGKRYVGSAAQGLRKRLSDYRCAFKYSRCHNGYLQNSWNKHGAASFVFVVLETCDADSCINREQFWMDFYQSYNPERGFNLCPVAGNNLGVRMSEKTKRRASERMLANPLTPEQLRILIDASRTPEALAKRSASLKGKCNKTLEHRAKLSAANKGKKQSPEAIAKSAAARKGKKRSPETRAKMSQKAIENRENRRRAALTRWYGNGEQ